MLPGRPLPTRFELAISTRGAASCVSITPTGLPDCTSSVSSSASAVSSRLIAARRLVARRLADPAVDDELLRAPRRPPGAGCSRASAAPPPAASRGSEGRRGHVSTSASSFAARFTAVQPRVSRRPVMRAVGARHADRGRRLGGERHAAGDRGDADLDGVAGHLRALGAAQRARGGAAVERDAAAGPAGVAQRMEALDLVEVDRLAGVAHDQVRGLAVASRSAASTGRAAARSRCSGPLRAASAASRTPERDAAAVLGQQAGRQQVVDQRLDPRQRQPRAPAQLLARQVRRVLVEALEHGERARDRQPPASSRARGPALWPPSAGSAKPAAASALMIS